MDYVAGSVTNKAALVGGPGLGYRILAKRCLAPFVHHRDNIDFKFIFNI